MIDKIYFSSDRPTMFMMQGLPGSGKSTLAQEIVDDSKREIHIHSSDAIRKEMFGNESVQDKPQAVFTELHRRIKNDLRNGIDVVYDATNIEGKFRRAFMSELNSIPCTKMNVCITTPYETCLEYNAGRERKVPNYVIRKRYMNWQPPNYNEGFDYIFPIANGTDSTRWSLEYYLNIARNYDQKNSHHSLSLGEHGHKAVEYIKENHKNNHRLFLAALLHDCGKPFTQTSKNYRGEEDGDYHYYQHNCVGAYDSFLYLMNNRYSPKDIVYVSNLIYYHMHPYMSWKQSEKTKERDRKLLGDEMFNDILRLHEADVAAH